MDVFFADFRTISSLKSKLDKEKCAVRYLSPVTFEVQPCLSILALFCFSNYQRDELKASVDELEAKFGVSS